MKQRIIMILAASVAVLAIGSLLLIAQNARAQEDAAADLSARLTQQGIIVKEIQVESRAPFEISIVVQTKTDSSIFPSAEPLYGSIVPREVSLAQQHAAVKIDLVHLVIINPSGARIYESIEPVHDEVIPASHKLDDKTAGELIAATLPTDGMSIAALSVNTDSDGLRQVDVTLQAKDISEAQTDVVGIVLDLRHYLEDDTQGVQIAVFTMNVTIPPDQVVLKYSMEGGTHTDTMWHADGVYANGFSYPPTVEPAK